MASSLTQLPAVPVLDTDSLEETPARPARSFARRLLLRIMRSRYRRARLVVARHVGYRRPVHSDDHAALAGAVRPDTTPSRMARLALRVMALLRATAEVFSEAQAHRRAMRERYPQFSDL